jgi:hypothetical protein
VTAPPPLHANRWLALHWPPSTQRTPRDGAVAVRAEAGKKGARGDDAASASAWLAPRARLGGAAGKVSYESRTTRYASRSPSA